MAHDDPDSQAIRQELERVLSSPGFVRNERLSAFLRFVVEYHLDGRDREVKESVIAVEVFGRKPGYDPREDSIVRTEALRLRAKLAEYYTGEGCENALILELPKGRYTPVFRWRAREHEHVRSRRLRVRAAVAVLALLLTATGWWWTWPESAPIRIAVLPLENLSPDPDDAYFADGLTDELIRNVSVIDGLEVRSRTSSVAFRGRPRNVREAGQQLDVEYILEGSVLHAERRLRINVQLVRVRDDFPVWSGKFDRELADVFAVQDEISRGIVNNLRLQLGRGRRRYETSLGAYDLYLRGRALAQRPGYPSDHRFLRGIGLFEQAIAEDASFAPAYAALASLYAILSVQFPVDHSSEELVKMRAAARKAIELDPLLAEAHSALAMAYARDGQWQQADESFRQAIEMDPNNSSTYADYGYWLLAVVGRVDEALKQLRVAQRLDPLSSWVRVLLVDVLISAGRYEEAANLSQQFPESDPFKKGLLARAQFAQGHTAQAIQLVTDGWSSTNPLIRGFVGYIHARSGSRAEAEKRAVASRYPNEQALIFAGIGDKDRTFEALDRMAALGAQRVGVFLNYPELALLRDDPRSKAFREKVGLLPDRH